MRKIVMIVDDSIPIHTLVKKRLESEQLLFHSLYDGALAVATAISVRPDLILLDVDLSRLDGFRTCQQLKENALTAAIPVIFLSGNSLSDEKAKGLELGAADYISKPFKPDQLRALIISTLSNQHRHSVSAKSSFDTQLESQLAIAARHNRPLSCVVGELDCWGTNSSSIESRAVKDIIQSVGNSFVLTCRSTDTLMQLENGRVILLLADRTRYEASKVIEQLRKNIEQQLLAARNTGVNITYSFGIADTFMTTGENLLERANIAAQRARRRGGNRLAIARALTVAPLAA